MPNKCRHDMTTLVDSREKDGYRIRRYECGVCGLRFSTIEVHVLGNSTNGDDYLDVVARSVLSTYYGLNKDQIKRVQQTIAGMQQ